jgi:hypothetical protein
MRITINLARFGFIVYFALLFLLLSINNFAVGDLSPFFVFYFIQLVILLEVAGLILKKLDLTIDIKPAYLVLLAYSVINSLTLAFYPQLKDLIFNRLGHFISGIIFVLIAGEAVKAGLIKNKIRLTKPLYLLFIFSVASTAGVFNEILELGLDVAVGSHCIGPGFDTAIDLLMNTLGITAILIFQKGKYEQQS